MIDNEKYDYLENVRKSLYVQTNALSVNKNGHGGFYYSHRLPVHTGENRTSWGV